MEAHRVCESKGELSDPNGIYEILINAHAELAECQRLISVVKEFVDNNDLITENLCKDPLFTQGKQSV